MEMQTIVCDILVIGSGAAGSRAMLEAKKFARDLCVLLVVDSLCDAGGSTNLVASEALGINAPFNCMEDCDSSEQYERDIIDTGGGLADPALCRILARESAQRVRELIDMGAEFQRRDGRLVQQKLSGCTKARSLTCGGSTGRVIVQALKKASIQAGVEIAENIKITRLHQDQNGRVRGAYGIRNGTPVFISARAVVLATGGAGAIFSVNVTPGTQSADGWAMAYDAGCRFVNMEFFQCGPAVMHHGMKFIIHSHMWRLQPRLYNCYGKEFLADYCSKGVTPEQALEYKAMSYPFSVRTAAKYVDIAIFKEIMAGRGLEGGGICFDVTHVSREKLLEKAPITYETLLHAGIDIAKQPLELGLAVQNFNGGVIIDENGFTGVDGLFAAGEVTGGVHGSDRPGGNNLTDTQVFGYRAGRAAALAARENERGEASAAQMIGDMPLKKDLALLSEAGMVYYREMTIIRSRESVRRVLEFIGENEKIPHGMQVKNCLTVGRLLAGAIERRTESRGTHYREDYPLTQEGCPHRIVLVKGPDGLPVELEE